MSALLSVSDLDVSYGQTQVLFGVDLEVEEHEIVALLGTNGAGKSTLLKAITGVNPPSRGKVTFAGKDISGVDPAGAARLGIAQVPGGRGVFPSLTVAENLKIASWLFRKDTKRVDEAIARMVEMFPNLERRWSTPAGSLSGGEQQMVSLAQAFLSKPELLMIDELSLGLAPAIVERLLEVVREFHAAGSTIIVVEQSVHTALRLAERAVFMEKGEIRFSGPTSDLLDRPDVLRSVFLEGASAGLVSQPAVVAEDVPERDLAEITSRPIVLETVDLTKRYGGITAVDSVDIAVHEGEIHGIIGANGAGKTTLFDCLSGFTPINGGSILLAGEDVGALPAHKRASLGLARSFQDARLYSSLTVKENIAVALGSTGAMTNPVAAMFGVPAVERTERAISERAEELIELLGLGAFRDKFVGELSTGSRRMVEISTLLAETPKVLLLDEPSSGIAQRETEALGGLVRHIQSLTGCAIVVIEHDMTLLTSIADRITALELGGVITTGTSDEVLNHPRVVSSYLGGEMPATSKSAAAPVAPAADSNENETDDEPPRRRRRNRQAASWT